MTHRHRLPGQAGVALVSALVMMLVVLMLGVAAARGAINVGKSARLERDRFIAFAAAEAALADAERDIESAAATAPGRATLFGAGPSALGKGCGRGLDDLGLCPADNGGKAAPQWQQADFAANGATVAYGTFTGAQMATGGASLPAREPRYIIEFIPVTGAPANSGRLFRITAIGFGSGKSMQVVLQSYYRKPAPPAGPGGDEAGHEGGNGSGDGHAGAAGNGEAAAPTANPPPASALPPGRNAWREVPNWPELHRAAIK